MSRNGIRAWALLLIARGEKPADPKLEVLGFNAPLSANECQEIAAAAIRGDELFVTSRYPAGLTVENTRAICEEVR